jgi:periplasmic protein TonB
MKLFITAALFLSILSCHAQDVDPTFAKVSMEAHFPGGKPAWLKFLNKTIRYPDDAVNREIMGDVVVQFQVDEQGNLSDIHAISGPKKGGLRDEAVRVITASGKWEPMLQNGVKVKAVLKETISFKLEVSK